MAEERPLFQLMEQFPSSGTLQKILLRPERDVEVLDVELAEVSLEKGLLGDRYGKKGGKRQVTLIQAEHLPVIGAMLGKDVIDPALLRRNLVVRGINLLALKDQHFKIGEVILKGTGHCRPCSKMERHLGHGGYNAMRGHGGITATVIQGGTLRIGDEISHLSSEK